MQLAKCNYVDCGREEHHDHKCIFHLPNKNKKETELFMIRLSEEKKKAEEDPKAMEIDFTGFVFSSDTTFSKDTEFKKFVRFDEATFEGDVSFRKLRFSGDVSFIRATFYGDAEFDEVIFNGIAEFEQAIFGADAAFIESKFIESAVFGGVKFGGDGTFIGATFSGPAGFSGATFRGRAVFDEATFSQHAGFFETTFSEVAEFDDTTFSGGVHFRKTLFSNVLFMGARFGGLAIFERTVFQRNMAKSNDLGQFVDSRMNPEIAVTRFDGTIVDQNAEVRFIQPRERKNGELRVYAIDHVSFSNVDLERFNFQDVEWGTYKGRRAVIEEVLMGRSPFEDATPEKVRQIYARIRQNLESAQLYAEAGDFFVGEMEMKRIGLARDLPGDSKSRRALNWVRRNVSTIGLYKLLSLYGERWRRVLLWMGVSVPLFGLAQTLIYPSMSTPSLSEFLFVFWENFKRSFFVFFQLKTDNHLDIIERIWSGLLLGLTYIALRRQLERHHTA